VGAPLRLLAPHPLPLTTTHDALHEAGRGVVETGSNMHHMILASYPPAGTAGRFIWVREKSTR